MTAAILTQVELKQQLHYEPETGIFTRLVSNSPTTKVGEVAGTLNKNGYVYIFTLFQRYRAHRLAWLYMTGSMPNLHIDHINGIRSDNRFCNLREATNEQNCKNRKRTVANKSGFKGVSWSNHANKWVAFATVNGKRKNLGYFSSAELASIAFQDFVKSNHGEFYRAV
jgi:hypothetical protein